MEFKSYYVITRETLAHKRIYDNLTRMVTVDGKINSNAAKAPWKATNACHYCNANANVNA